MTAGSAPRGEPGSGAGNASPARLNPMPLVDPVRRFILFTNPKCGGTTLKAWFFNNLDMADLHRRPARLLRSFGPMFFYRHLRRGRPQALRVARFHAGAGESEAYKAALRDYLNFYRRAFCAGVLHSAEAERYFRICVARNPYDRIVSAYLDKFCNEGRMGREAPYVREMLRGLGRSDLTFRQFLAYLRTTDEKDQAIHWRRQTYLLEGQRIDAFVRLEALHDEMARLADIVGAEHLAMLQEKLQATRVGGNEGRPAPDMTDVSNLEIAAQRRASGRFPPRECFLTPEAQARIREIYALDFARLPYDP